LFYFAFAQELKLMVDFVGFIITGKKDPFRRNLL